MIWIASRFTMRHLLFIIVQVTVMKNNVTCCLFVVLLLFAAIVPVSCGQNEPPEGKGRLTGTVRDRDTTSRTFEGAIIKINRATEAGTYKLSADSPEQSEYETGSPVAEITSGKNGNWQADLEPGKYCVRAFYEDASYSDEIPVDLVEGETKTVDLELVHGM
jgi:hypothetical protein